jgi:enamine deaminase RidA (YjgF/YER057c/UK114 family)
MRHEIARADVLAEPRGYAHAVIAAPGRTVYLSGQTALDADGVVRVATMSEQFDVAAGNVVTALAAAGGQPDHLVSLTIYVTDVVAYKESLRDLGVVYQKHFGRHYVATALLGVRELFDDDAMVELVGVAVIPEPGSGAVPSRVDHGKTAQFDDPERATSP